MSKTLQRMDPGTILRAATQNTFYQTENNSSEKEDSFQLANSPFLAAKKDSQLLHLINAFQVHFDNTIKILRSSKIPFDVYELFREHEMSLVNTHNKLLDTSARFSFAGDPMVLGGVDNHFLFQATSIECTHQLEDDTSFSPPSRRRSNSNGSDTRSRIPKDAVALMEKVFKVKRFLNSRELNALAKKCGITNKQVRTWFTNKRVRSKNVKRVSI